MYKLLLLIADNQRKSSTSINPMKLTLTPIFFLLFSLVLICYSPQSSAFLQPNVDFSKGINKIVQDEQGYIWVAGFNGITRYDSTASIQFSVNSKTWPTPFNWVNDIIALSNNRLLVASNAKGVWYFDTLTGESTPLKTSITDKVIRRIHLFKHFLFIASEKTLYRINLNTGQTIALSEQIHIKHIVHTDSGVYFSATDGLYIENNNQLKKLYNFEVYAVAASANQLVFATSEEIKRITSNGQIFSQSIDSPIHAIIFDNNSQKFLAINSQGEINAYDNLELTPQQHHYPSQNPVIAKQLFIDSTQGLWILSDLGMKRVSQLHSKNHQKIFDVLFNAISVTGFNNELILASYGDGLFSFNPEINAKLEGLNHYFTDKGKIITDLVNWQGQLFIATFDGIWKTNTELTRVSKLGIENNDKLIIKLTLKNNKLYIATDDAGVLAYNLTKNSIDNIISVDKLTHIEAFDVLPISQHRLWIAASHGFDIYDGYQDEVRHVTVPAQSEVISLVEYQDKVFVATKGDGIYVYSKHGDLLSHIAPKLSFGRMTLIDNTIWVAGTPGLYIVNPESYQVKLVPTTNNYTFSHAPIALNNAIYTGHYKGVLEVPKQQNDAFSAPIYIAKNSSFRDRHT